MMPNESRIPVYGILPAAGMSRRMGIAKQSLPVGDSTMTARTAQTMLAAGLDAVVVVTRTELLEAINLPLDDRLLVAINDDPSSQMLDSIRLGLDHLDDSHKPPPNAGFLVIPGDMPTVPPHACDRCIEAFRKSSSNIFIATCNGKRGHPIVFPAAMRQSLSSIEGGLNELPHIHPKLVREIDMDELAILRDVDTLADYDRLDRKLD